MVDLLILYEAVGCSQAPSQRKQLQQFPPLGGATSRQMNICSQPVMVSFLFGDGKNLLNEVGVLQRDLELRKDRTLS